MNTLRFHSKRMLESIINMQVSLEGPLDASKDYISETMNDIAKCINCTRLHLMNASLITSTSFRKLSSLHLTRLTLRGCRLTDDDIAWFFTANKATLEQCQVIYGSFAPFKALKALRQCSRMTDFHIMSINTTPVPFKLLTRANEGMPRLKNLTIEVVLFESIERLVMDLMLSYKRRGTLRIIHVKLCNDMEEDDLDVIQGSTINAYKNNPNLLELTLNDRRLIRMNLISVACR